MESHQEVLRLDAAHVHTHVHKPASLHPRALQQHAVAVCMGRYAGHLVRSGGEQVPAAWLKREQVKLRSPLGLSSRLAPLFAPADKLPANSSSSQDGAVVWGGGEKPTQLLAAMLEL